MEVEFNAGLTGNIPVSQSPVRREPAQSAASEMSFDNTQALEQTLKETPTVRPEAINRAAALLSDPGYPSDEVMNRVATVLAQNIGGQQPT
ncbi:MAG TPA: hypothetical protein VGJ73_17460 [Verrucomicrobiae bacterium]|jgi:hypothetical protein